MQVYSSTSLNYWIKHCPMALEFHLSGVHENTDQFQAGIAAHAILQVVGEKKLKDIDSIRIFADSVMHKCITEPRRYYDKEEPPMPAAAAFEGREMALNYLMQNELPDGAKYEIALAMDAKGNPCDLGKARYRALIDCIYEDKDGDEDFAYDVVVVRDYKSAWPTNESELETLQRCSQAVLAWLHYPDKQGIRLEVVNLRTGATFTKSIYFTEENIAMLDQWRKDILRLCNDADKNRHARVGNGCLTCSFAGTCPAVKASANSDNTAQSYVALESLRKDAMQKLKAELQESSGITFDKTYLGYRDQGRNILTPAAIKQILANWYDLPLDVVESEKAQEVGLLKVLGLGSGNVEAFAKFVFKGEHRQEKQEFLELCLTRKPQPVFGIWAKEDEAEAEKV